MARKPRKSRAAPAVSEVEDGDSFDLALDIQNKKKVEDEINALKMLNKKKAELVALKLEWTNTKSGHDRAQMEPRIRELEVATR